jgi:hypothetical protein
MTGRRHTALLLAGAALATAPASAEDTGASRAARGVFAGTRIRF